MVTEINAAAEDGATGCWELRPTRSMTWSQAKQFILVVTVISFAIGGFFLAYGYPFVIPFSGLEAAAVAAAFYLVLRDGERREVLRLDGDDLIVESGMHQVERRDSFNRYWVRVEISGPPYRYHPTRLFLSAHGRRLEVGRFLTDSERESFSRILVNALKKNR